MSSRGQSCIVSGMVFTTLILAGCLSPNIGSVVYTGGGLSVTLSHTGGPSDAYLQVTVYRIQNLHQEEIAVLGAPVTLRQGETTILVPGTLEPGQYKLYVYLTQNGSRKTAVVRDIEVA